ncbi:MAG: hypothetical protein HC831_20660 [Chloroflexia bacterium]|nr:hypothetical protein [Chloroflexia bacterium]
MNDKVYAGQWHDKNWIDGVASEIIQPDRQDNSWDLFAADGTNVYNLFKTSFGYTILKNGQFLYNMLIDAVESEYVQMVDMTYTDGHLYICGLDHNSGAIWRDGELWKKDATPGSYFSSYYRIKVKDGDVYTSGYIYDEYERLVFSLFKNGTSMTQMDLGDEIINFEIGNEAAYIFIRNENESKDYFIKVGLSGGTVYNIYPPDTKDIGYHDIVPLSGSINHTPYSKK